MCTLGIKWCITRNAWILQPRVRQRSTSLKTLLLNLLGFHYHWWLCWVWVCVTQVIMKTLPKMRVSFSWHPYFLLLNSIVKSCLMLWAWAWSKLFWLFPGTLQRGSYPTACRSQQPSCVPSSTCTSTTPKGSIKAITIILVVLAELSASTTTSSYYWQALASKSKYF